MSSPVSRRKVGRLRAATGIVALVTVGASLVGFTASGAASLSAAKGLAYAKAEVAEFSGRASLPVVTPVKHPANLKGKTIWYIPLTNAVDSLAGMGTVMKSALAKVGANVEVCDGGGLPTTVATCLTNAQQQGAAAVVTSFVDYEMAPSAFQALEAAHIPVIVGDEPPDPGVTANKYLQFTYGTASTEQFASLMAFETIVASKGKANVLVISLTDSASTIAGTTAELAVFKKYCPDCTVTTMDMQTAAISQVPSNVAAALSANPNINYITVPVDAYLPPVQGALNTANLASKIKVLSADGGVAGLQDVVSGSLVADDGGPIEFVGWQYADAVIRILSGDPVPPTPAGPAIIFTKANLVGKTLNETQYLTVNWYGLGEKAFEAPYLKAWGLK